MGLKYWLWCQRVTLRVSAGRRRRSDRAAAHSVVLKSDGYGARKQRSWKKVLKKENYLCKSMMSILVFLSQSSFRSNK
jgi:hypothetical protein